MKKKFVNQPNRDLTFNRSTFNRSFISTNNTLLNGRELNR